MLLIIGNNRDDVIYFKTMMKDIKEENILNQYRAFTGKIFNQEVMVLQDIYTSFVSSSLVTYLIDNYFILLVICVGTCQTLDTILKVGDVAVCQNAVFGDVDQIRSLRGTKLGQIPGYPQIFTCNPYIFKNAMNTLSLIPGLNVYATTFVSSSFYRRDLILIEELGLQENIANKNIHRVIDGETAGIALATSLFDIPFLSIKVVDSVAGEKTSVNDYVKVLEKYSLIGKAIVSFIGEISTSDVVRE